MELIRYREDYWRPIKKGIYRALAYWGNTNTTVGDPYIEIREVKSKDVIVKGWVDTLKMVSTKPMWALEHDSVFGDTIVIGDDGWVFIDFQKNVKIFDGQYEFRVKEHRGTINVNGYDNVDFVAAEKPETTKIERMWEYGIPIKSMYVSFDVEDLKKIRFVGTLQNIKDVWINDGRKVTIYDRNTLRFDSLSDYDADIKRDDRKASVRINVDTYVADYPYIVFGKVSNFKYGV